MLANTPNILQMCSFDANKSTKGASKLRRDLINAEIANLRDLLPLPSSTRQRLSQLQLMALVCVYVRKANYFQHAFRKHDLSHEVPTPPFGFSKALNGFLMMMTQNGKLLYISDNAAEYLGHSMEDLLIHGDSVYDIIEKQDHQTIQAELMRSPNPLSLVLDTRMFLCRMNVSRNARRQMRFGDQKVVLVQGHFVSFLPLCSRNEPVFLATCTPVAMPETRECVVQGSTNVFTSIHSMDMKFLHIDRNGEFHLGYTKSSLQGLSWYELVHWEHLREAQSKHRLITQSEQERSCILLLRLQSSSGSWLWVHVVLQVKDSSDSSQQPVIVCTNQVLSDREAAVMRANNWLYQFYSLHSKMHYGLAYEAHATRLPTYYSAMMPYHHPPPPAEGTVLHPPYHLHPPGAPLNGSAQHSPTVLQYGMPTHQGTLSSLYTSISMNASSEGTRSQPPKRPLSPPPTESSEPYKRQPFPRPSFSYTGSVFGGGLPAPVPVPEIGSMVPAMTGYYGSTQVLTSVPYHQIGSSRNAKHLTTDEEMADVEQSLTPTNTEEVSNMISPTYIRYSVPRGSSYVPYNHNIPTLLSDTTRSTNDSNDESIRTLGEPRYLSDPRPRTERSGSLIESGASRDYRLPSSRLPSPYYSRYNYGFCEVPSIVSVGTPKDRSPPSNGGIARDKSSPPVAYSSESCPPVLPSNEKTTHAVTRYNSTYSLAHSASPNTTSPCHPEANRMAYGFETRPSVFCEVSGRDSKSSRDGYGSSSTAPSGEPSSWSIAPTSRALQHPSMQSGSDSCSSPNSLVKSRRSSSGEAPPTTNNPSPRGVGRPASCVQPSEETGSSDTW